MHIKPNKWSAVTLYKWCKRATKDTSILYRAVTTLLNHVILSPLYQLDGCGGKRIICVRILHHDGIYAYDCRHLVVVMHPLQVHANRGT